MGGGVAVGHISILGRERGGEREGVCVCVCECERERERESEREREREKQCVFPSCFPHPQCQREDMEQHRCVICACKMCECFLIL
jgi:hypothetical protein